VGAGVLLALTAACGGGQSTTTQPGAGGPELPTSTSVSSEPSASPPLPGGEQGSSVPSGAKQVPPAKIDKSALPEGYPLTVWTEADGSRVGVVAQEGGCSKASVEIAEQGDTNLVLNLIESTPAKQQMCTMDMRYPAFVVALNAPLGDRTLVLKYQRRAY
jgi:hypothetical protein